MMVLHSHFRRAGAYIFYPRDGSGLVARSLARHVKGTILICGLQLEDTMKQ
jgi:hypothetical protein